MTSDHVGRALRRLLTAPAARAVWRPYATRPSRKDPHRRAVASVVAQMVLGDELLVNRVRDRVRDAVDGTRASVETVEQIARAFGFTLDMTELLLKLRDATGAEAEGLLSAVPEEATSGRPYRTVQLHEIHELGPKGWPIRHTTVQTIQAVENDLRAIEYSYVPGEDDVATVDVTMGGKSVDTRTAARPDHPGLMITTIELSTILAAGDPHDLTYVTTFDYSEQPEQAFRRGVSSQVEVITIKVVFDRQRLPAKVWQTEWTGDDGREVTLQQRQRLRSSEPSVQLIRRHPDSRWVGYQWEWPDPGVR